MKRRCGACGEGLLEPVSEVGLRGGGREITWQCGTCGTTVKLLSPLGQLTFFVLSAFFVLAVPFAMVTDRIARQSERPWIVLLLAVVAAWLVGVLVLDVRKGRKHPPLPPN